MTLNYNEILGNEAESLLSHQCKGITKEQIYQIGPNWISDIMTQSDRPVAVLRNLQTLLNAGRLGKTGYTSIFPVDQGVEHSAGASFAPNPLFFDAENIIKFAVDCDANAVASTLGVLGLYARKYAHKIPFVL